jgi:small subunit ribosomal protein S9
MQEKNLVVSGKRKTAIAKAVIKEGKGAITINKRPISHLSYLQQLEINEPLTIALDVLGKLSFDVSINVKGGGTACQVEAARLALAKAIIAFTKNDTLKAAFLTYDRNMLIADTRRKETCKPGDSKARAMRQTSFR